MAEYEIEKGSEQVVVCLPSSSPNDASELIYAEPAGGEKRWFELDAVFDQNSTQIGVYEKSGAKQAVVENIFKGFNCTILAYGQTGAGKTFTMGTAPLKGAELTDNCGVIPRVCHDLFATIGERCDNNAEVELQYMEVYNEEIRDLLSGQKDQSQLRIRENLNGEVYVRGLQSRIVKNPEDIGHVMEEASARRVTASTKMNAVSSRSHAICVLRIKGVLEDTTKFQAKLTLVDLAGSERIKKTGAEGSRAQEGISINKGLFVLGQVVSALAEQRPKMKRRPPYRDSKLTRLLQDSLGGNSRTIMIACVSPADFNMDESVNTLRYATSARNIKNTATRNVVKALSHEEAAKLMRENELLKQQVAELQHTIEKMTADFENSESTPMENGDDKSITMMDDINGDAEPELELPEHTSKRVVELENEVKNLKYSLEQAKNEAHRATANHAIELPALKVQIAMLEESLNESKVIEEEAELLQHEFEDLKNEAHSARTAADRLSHIVQDSMRFGNDSMHLGQDSMRGESVFSGGDDSSVGSIRTCESSVFGAGDMNKLEYNKVKINELWVNFVVDVFKTFAEDMRLLGGMLLCIEFFGCHPVAFSRCFVVALFVRLL
jgi:hypothetical protein